MKIYIPCCFDGTASWGVRMKTVLEILAIEDLLRSVGELVLPQRNGSNNSFVSTSDIESLVSQCDFIVAIQGGSLWGLSNKVRDAMKVYNKPGFVFVRDSHETRGFPKFVPSALSRVNEGWPRCYFFPYQRLFEMPNRISEGYL